MSHPSEYQARLVSSHWLRIFFKASSQKPHQPFSTLATRIPFRWLVKELEAGDEQYKNFTMRVCCALKWKLCYFGRSETIYRYRWKLLCQTHVMGSFKKKYTQAKTLMFQPLMAALGLYHDDHDLMASDLGLDHLWDVSRCCQIVTQSSLGCNVTSYQDCELQFKCGPGCLWLPRGKEGCHVPSGRKVRSPWFH